MLFSRGFFVRGFFAFLLIFPFFLKAQLSDPALSDRYKQKPDSLSMQIQAYENIVEELQRQPSSYGSLANIMTQLGDLYSASEDYPKAIYLYMRSIIMRQMGHSPQNKDKSTVAWQMIEVGNSFYRLRDYQLAENAYQNAARYFNNINDKQGLITAINNIGLCLLNQEKPEKAYPVFLQTLEFSKQINDTPRVYSSTIYVGISLAKMKQYKKAIGTLNSVEHYELANNNLDLEDFRKLQLGEIYILSGDTSTGIETYLNLTQNARDLSGVYYKSLALDRLAWFYLKNNNYQRALDYAAEAYLLLKDKHHLTLITDVHDLLFQLYKKAGDINKALFHFEAYHNGIMQLNNSEIETFVNDYNKKMERIAISHELKSMRENSERIRIEKSNQQNLSVFLVIIAVLLLIMLFTAKGFDARIGLLLDHIRSYSKSEKIYLLLFLGVYFLVFYYFFVPVENAVGLRNLSFTERLYPGLIAFIVSLVLLAAFYSPVAVQKKVKNWYVYSLFVFGLAFLSVLLAEFVLFYIRGFGGFNFLLSLSIIVLASFIVPLYLFILIVEKLVVRHVASISDSLNQYIDQMRQKPGPDKKMITLQSEKTSGRLSFDISELVSVEAQGNYSMFVLFQNQQVNRKMLHITMKAIEEGLSDYEYIVRCHKSYMVNIQHIAKVTGNSRGYLVNFEMNSDPVPVSRNFQKNVMAVIRKFKDGF